MQALMQADKFCYRHVAEQWLAGDPDDAHTGYIQDRLIRYNRTFDQIRTETIEDSRSQSIILWNHRLFFEVHEHLERVWHQTDGAENQALKGLIQAAGVYVHLNFGHQPAAERLAVKALIRLQKYPDQLTFIDNLAPLLNGLKNLDRSPPYLMVARR